MKEVSIYTDGGASGNPGPGGYGVVLIYGEHRKELTGGYRLTTNNRMELLAAIEGLKALKHPCRVVLVSDSKYLVNGIEKGWARRWRSRGWVRNKEGDLAVNPDLWAELLLLVEKHEVELKWVKGHSGHPENERCDSLAVASAKLPNLPPDPGYPERLMPPGSTLFS